ncbi:hypothetical protein HJC99_05085 [Candidatus Saccharibacteria bacterium]|nr:hypothetical protein [Candidatus Saccharibacteria bacterium]
MAKIVIILTLMCAYFYGLNAFNDRAQTQIQQLSQFYTATGNPDTLLSAASK